MKYYLHICNNILKYSAASILLNIIVSQVYASDMPLLWHSIQGAPVNVTASLNFAAGKTVNDVCGASLVDSDDAAQAQIAAAEKSVALSNLLRCLEIHDAHASAIKAVTEAMQRYSRINRFYSLNFGVGFGFSQASKEIIKEAAIVNGVIKSTEDRTDKMRFILESHIFLFCKKTRDGVNYGCGPFLALGTGVNEAATGVGIGWLWGWQNIKPASVSGLSLGIGLLADNNLRSLASGFEVDKPLPAGETSIKYDKKSRCSSLIFISHSF